LHVGFRAYRREVVEAIPWERLHSTGYSFLVEVLYWSARAGRRVQEVPITYVDRTRGNSKMGVRQIVSARPTSSSCASSWRAGR
jgi:dolichol-phosphate mannosyltransferase